MFVSSLNEKRKGEIENEVPQEEIMEIETPKLHRIAAGGNVTT